ncbi:hypothetical protein [Rhizobium sp. RM]|uniref:hypothetical protein n=1 Tax=Rhizobium sp. RM TaxID=2748079 RepID=UPI00110DADB4|nr:hypothetical protein [Rhizobium sp. RM]NWJ26047.1 hypothetical protein [Rhizobium sp. RM]TMV20654.1 hypothetical protein BJG94_08080 [Rhizobium sp. Td3]
MTKIYWKIYSASSLALLIFGVSWDDYDVVRTMRTVAAFFVFLCVCFYAFDVQWKFPFSKRTTCTALLTFTVADSLWTLVVLYRLEFQGLATILAVAGFLLFSYLDLTAIYRYGFAPD